MGGLFSSRSSEPVSRPTACLIPPQVPLTKGRGRSWGDAVGRWRTGCHLPGGAAQRSRPHDTSSGGSAADVTPSAATGAAVEPLRSLQIRHSAARHRAWRVTGGTIWRAGRDRSAAAGAERRSVRPAGSFPRSGKETRAAIPGHGNGPLSCERRHRRPDLAVRHRDEGAALIAAFASEPARPTGPKSGDTLRANERGAWRRARVRDGRPKGRDAGPLTAARRASATARPRAAGTRPVAGLENHAGPDQQSLAHRTRKAQSPFPTRAPDRRVRQQVETWLTPRY